MRRVRSGFYKKRRRNRNLKAVGLLMSKKTKKFLSKDLLTSNVLTNFFKKGSTKSTGRRTKRNYLRRDILEKQFNNPNQKKLSYTKAIKRKLLTQRFRIAQISLVIITVAWFTQLFIKPTFYLERIHITGTEEISPDEVRALAQEHMNKRSLLIIKRAHIFFLNQNKLEQVIRENYSLDSLSFESHWPSKVLSISLQEKIPVALYNVKDKHYAIDIDGRVIRETPEEEITDSLPVIYQYSDTQPPQIGELAFEHGFVPSIQALAEGLNKYPEIEVHSFRLKESEQKKIVLKDKYSERKELEASQEGDERTSSEDLLEEALDSIAQAASTEDKVSELRELIGSIEVEKLEEERVEQLLQAQKEFTPSETYTLNELEVYTRAGWSIRLGHEILESPELVEIYLDIFATLSRQVDLAGEVNEYIDLRFPNRIYYR